MSTISQLKKISGNRMKNQSVKVFRTQLLVIAAEIQVFKFVWEYWGYSYDISEVRNVNFFLKARKLKKSYYMKFNMSLFLFYVKIPGSNGARYRNTPHS